MNIPATNLTTVNPGQKRMERPTDYVGELETTGKDVVVAVIDSGISKHPDVVDSIAVAVSFDKGRQPSADDWGHGTATAGVIVGSGAASEGKIKGVAPGAKLINLPVFTKEANESGQGGLRMLSALNWVADNHEKFQIRVLNISGGLQDLTGGSNQVGTFLDPLDSAVRRVLESGVVIVAAAGNDGPNPGSIKSSPNHHPEVITVGSLNTNGSVQDYSDDFVAAHSSRGPGPMGNAKPDLVAPGVGLLTAAVEGSQIHSGNETRRAWYEPLKQLPDEALLPNLSKALAAKQLSPKYFDAALPELMNLLPDRMKAAVQKLPPEGQSLLALRLSGALASKGALNSKGEAFQATIAKLHESLEKLAPAPTLNGPDGQAIYLAENGSSLAAPIVTSVVAHMLEVNPELKPQQVKDILKSTARPVPGADVNSAGAGAVNAQAAIEMARTLSEV